MSPVTLLVLVIGGLVTMMSLAAAFLVGLTEADDPEQADRNDLSSVERALTDRDDLTDGRAG